MLSYDSLLSQARERGMPPAKLRGAAREYLQVLVLKTLYSRKGAERLIFLGGTALRLGHGLPRFSEDLDFDAAGLRAPAWKSLLEATAHALGQAGLPADVSAGERGTLLTGELRFRGFLQAYGLTKDPGEKLRVKVEANRPRYPLASEPRVISGFGEIFPVPFAAPGLIFAEKILALLSREMARDVFDACFLAGKRWVPDPSVLRRAGLREPPAQAILGRVKSFGAAKLRRMARQLEPFLFEPAQARLVEQARELLPEMLTYLEKPSS